MFNPSTTPQKFKNSLKRQKVVNVVELSKEVYITNFQHVYCKKKLYFKALHSMTINNKSVLYISKS